MLVTGQYPIAGCYVNLKLVVRAELDIGSGWGPRVFYIRRQGTDDFSKRMLEG